MAVKVTTPKLGLTMTEAHVIEWLIEEGEAVVKGQPLVRIETEKVVTDVESPEDGIVGQIVALPDQVVPVAGLLAWIAAPGEEIPAAEVVGMEAVRPREPARLKASPLARRMAREAGLDLATIAGTGPGGRITKEDVERALAERARVVPFAIPVSEVIPMAGVRQIIAARVSESVHTAARVTLTTEADATDLVELRERLRSSGLSLSYNDLLVKIVAIALREHPRLNARFIGEEIQLLDAVNVGLAVEAEHGLLVPVIKDADKKGLAQICEESKELIERARAGKSLPDDLAGGTFTITNLGMYEIDAFTPIINLPECAILGVGRIVPKPVVHEGGICIRRTMCLSLSFDHRLIDGAPAAKFLQRIKQLIEKPPHADVGEELLGQIADNMRAVDSGGLS